MVIIKAIVKDKRHLLEVPLISSHSLSFLSESWVVNGNIPGERYIFALFPKDHCKNYHRFTQKSLSPQSLTEIKPISTKRPERTGKDSWTQNNKCDFSNTLENHFFLLPLLSWQSPGWSTLSIPYTANASFSLMHLWICYKSWLNVIM